MQKRKTYLFALLSLVFVSLAMTVFARQVRTVDVLGIFACGVAAGGCAIAALQLAWRPID